MSRRASTLLWQIGIGLAALATWQWAWDVHERVPWLVPELFDPYFVSKPSEIFKQFLGMSCLVSSGRMIIEAEARGEAAGMMVAVFVLMIVGVILPSLVHRLQTYLLRWRPAQNVAAWGRPPRTPALS